MSELKGQAFGEIGGICLADMAITYFIDISALINLSRRYPKHSFPSAWGRIGSLIKEKRLRSCKQVKYEIRYGYEELKKWCDRYSDVFPNIDGHIEQVHEVIRTHPELANPNASHETSDPYIIALAVSHKLQGHNPVMVTDENRQQKSGIPRVARTYDIESCGLVEMFQRENWKM